MEETEFEKKLKEKAEEETQVEEEIEPSAEPEAASDLNPEEALKLEVAQLKDQLLRARADFDNYRKRMAREVERIRKTAAEGLIHDVLPVLDNLELALQHAENNPQAIGEGVNLVCKQFQDVLSQNGLSPIPALGETFDPNIHEAVSQTPSDAVPRDHVVEEFQRGYRLGEQVLRPSKVVVSLGAPGDAAADESTDENDDVQP